MPEVSHLRLSLLRAMYLFIVAGLVMAVWPNIVAPASHVANANTVVWSLLGALSLLAALGLRYPLQMLPLLVFELLWKIIWVAAYAIPMWAGPGLNEYATATLIECSVGLVLLPLVLPWPWLWRRYAQAPGAPWTRASVQPNSTAIG